MDERITEQQPRQIYGDTIDALYRFASHRCGGDRQLAEDVTQEVWLRAVRDWRRNGLPGNPLAWLMAVARNLILNQLRRRQSVSLDSVSPAEILAAVEDNRVSDSVEIATAVAQALLRLPEGEARLLETFHYDKIKMSQLAETYGISERAVEGRLRRARERLRRELEITLKIERGLA
ncbi:MAG TPA: sigma-70 family RNA polymerase sigma factor [Gemmatimonadaceae bacterium]|nr:sigma-70 family RNA polymerase sigma factor [Gemmatimonadaceae bacterium]